MAFSLARKKKKHKPRSTFYGGGDVQKPMVWRTRTQQSAKIDLSFASKKNYEGYKLELSLSLSLYSVGIQEGFSYYSSI